MKSQVTLPEGYRELYRVDLQKDKKAALLVNGLGAAVGILLAVLGHFLVPISALFDLSDGFGAYFLRFGVLLAGMVAYIFLHEAVHGIFMKRYCSAKVRYGFTGLYAYAGSDGYYDKRSYRIIALAPVVLWGLVLLILNLFLSGGWWWVVFLIQITNLSGAAGDLYVTAKFHPLPETTLINDTGTAMTVYIQE